MTHRGGQGGRKHSYICVFGSEEDAPKGFDDEVVITFKVNHIFEFESIFEILLVRGPCGLFFIKRSRLVLLFPTLKHNSNMTLHSPKYSNLKAILLCAVARCGASNKFLKVEKNVMHR
jgi:hypothetical protein